MRIFVTGATGFLGSHVLPRLLAAGHAVRCLVRPGSEARLGACRGQVEPVEGDLARDAPLDTAMAGCEVAIHMAGVLEEDERLGQTHERVIEQGMRSVYHAARRTGLAHLLFTSTYGARFGSGSGFRRANRRAEECLRLAGIPRWTIFRLNYVFGDPGPGREDALLTHLRTMIDGQLPVLVVVGSGRNLVQPIHVDDVAEALVAAVARSGDGEELWDASGPTRVAWIEFLELIRQAAGRPRKRIVRLHPCLAGALAPGLWRLGMSKLGWDTRDRVCDPAPFYARFGMVPTPFTQDRIAYLRRYPRGWWRRNGR